MRMEVCESTSQAVLSFPYRCWCTSGSLFLLVLSLFPPASASSCFVICVKKLECGLLFVLGITIMDQRPKGNTGNCFPETKAFPSMVKYTGLFHHGSGSNLLWVFLVVPCCLVGFGPLARRGKKEERFSISGNSWFGEPAVVCQDRILFVGGHKQQQKALGLPGICPG